MDDSSPSPRGQDAFAKTLEFKPRQRSSVSSTNSGRPTSSLRAKEGSVNRLSRVFAQDTSSSNPHDAHIQAKKPSIPTKPPSLRIPNQHALNNTASVPSHQPLSTPALTTPTQHAMEPPPSSSSNEHESSIDETSLRFQDIRARFQQESSTVKVPSPRNTVSNNRSRPTSFAPSKGYRTTLSPKPVIPINDSQSNLGARSPARNKESSSSSLPSSSVAEISKRLEKNDKAGLKRSVKELSPAPVTARPSVPSLSRPSAIPTHRKAGEPIPSRTSLSKRASNPCMASSIQPNNTGSSAASLNIPMIARSVTGNSVMSTASTASTSSSSVTGSSAKKSWHYGTAITSWFTGNHTDDAQHQSLKDSITIVSKEPVQPSAASTSPPSSSDTSFSDSLPISPQLSGRDEVGYKVIKRSKVVQELFETEKVFQSDMMLLKEVYYDQARLPDSPFTKNDVKILFSNILAIAELEDMFIALLQNACDTSQRRPSATSLSSDNDIDNTSVGMAFREMMHRIDEVYSEYCKRHEDAVLKLQEVQSIPKVQEFLAKCKEDMQGRTTSWDLGSLLIKPVQRVLKYPLLLREISLLTPAEHPDAENLAIAVKEIQEVADHINEIKRRKDIVEKIVGDKKRTEINVVHGINKKLTRRAQRFRQVTGFASGATQDALFDALNLRFEEQQEIARQLARDLQNWVRHVKEQLDNLQLFACSLETLYSSYGGVRVRSMNNIRAFNQAASVLANALLRELDNTVKSYTLVRIEGFLRVFENPTQVISKRAKKLLDYDRVRDLKSKGDVPDKALQESADAYLSINAQLIDELPKFFGLTTTYFDILIGDLSILQANFYAQLTAEWKKLAILLYDGQEDVDETLEQIVQQYETDMVPVEEMIQEITPLNKTQWNALTTQLLSPSRPRRTGTNGDGYFDRSMSAPSFNDHHASSEKMHDRSPMEVGNRSVGQLVDLSTSPDINSFLTATPSDEPVFQCVVLYDYEADEPDALSIREGDQLLIWESTEHEEWWYGHLGKQSGWIPACYCKKL